MDELLRQEGLGHAVSYIEIEFDGFEQCTNENSEGGLVDRRWEIREKTRVQPRVSGCI
jgi:hypothetical protein